jgi:hypothetical protein
MHLVKIRIHCHGTAQGRCRRGGRFPSALKLGGVEGGKGDMLQPRRHGLGLSASGGMELRIPLPIHQGEGIGGVRGAGFAVADQ